MATMFCLSNSVCQNVKIMAESKVKRKLLHTFRKLKYMCIATREIMDCMFEAYLTQDNNAEPDDIPITKDPLFILGKQYHTTTDLCIIRREIQSKLWFTYRKGFVPIGGAEGLTSDRGWGCMLRCGQMVLAQALITAHLGKDWYWDPECKDPIYLKILRKFEDNRQAPFSIHQIALMGASEGKEVGQWFGPNTVAQVLKKLIKYDEWCEVAMHVALDNTVIVSDIRELCLGSKKSITWKPLILIVPLRLGLLEINPIYVKGIQTCFKFKQSLGVIGGKPNLALYFIGCVGEEVIYLDPHTTQRTGSVESKETEEQFEIDMSYHCRRASRMNILAMDPSIAVCFFCETEEDFVDLCKKIGEDLIRSEKQPLFEIVHERPKVYLPSCVSSGVSSGFSSISRDVDGSYDSENDFEIL